ncbi:unnamed protein product [Dracunculus medinensis]|uniref:Peptidase A1 domain-containing protein n=1 Tax=Dracunculus medinensis TaxID=318479 RepID=A0A0N4UQI3_DRAME|nr:unnamed protein product [Dracunculus medinensis]
MYFHSGKNKKISFISGAGGSIYFGDTDISLLPELVWTSFI